MNRAGTPHGARRVRTLASWLAGIGEEALLSLVLAGIAAAVLTASRLLRG